MYQFVRPTHCILYAGYLDFCVSDTLHIFNVLYLCVFGSENILLHHSKRTSPPAHMTLSIFLYSSLKTTFPPLHPWTIYGCTFKNFLGSSQTCQAASHFVILTLVGSPIWNIWLLLSKCSSI